MKVPDFSAAPSSLQTEVDQLKDGQGLFDKTLNIAFSGVATVHFNGSLPANDVAVVAHNLGYTPAFMAFVQWKDPVSGVLTQQSVPFIYDHMYVGSGGDLTIWAFVDLNNFTVRLRQGTAQTSAPVDYPVKFYLYRELSSQ